MNSYWVQAPIRLSTLQPEADGRQICKKQSNMQQGYPEKLQLLECYILLVYFYFLPGSFYPIKYLFSDVKYLCNNKWEYSTMVMVHNHCNINNTHINSAADMGLA